MGWFDNLKNLIDINIGDISLVDITQVKIEQGQQESPAVVEDDELIVDVEAVDEENRDDIREIMREAWDEEGELLSSSAYEQKEAIEAAEEEEIEETLSYFRPKISDHHVRILRAALYLREMLPYLPRDQALERKRDVREKFGPEAYPIISLCSAGYFDEGGYLRELYEEMQSSSDYKEGDYREVFSEIIQNQPFTVFVSVHQSSDQIKAEIKDKLSKFHKYQVDFRFVDVRGIGSQCQEIIESAMDGLENELDNIGYRTRIEDNELRVRIDPETVEGLDET